MVGSHEAEDNRLTGRVARAPRHGPPDDRPVIDDGGDVETPAEGTAAADGSVAPADPEIETVTRLMGFLRDSDDG